MAWTKKVLRVNLTTGTCAAEPLNMEWAQEYIGQRGLATRYLVEEIDPTCDALGPDNKMIMATGPLTGTSVSTAGRYSVITKSPLTGCVACSNSGGFIGAEIKMAGWDMIIFEGKSPEPVYLYLENDRAELKSADGLWGKSVWETDRLVHEIHGDPQIRIAAVGRAAEQGCLYSSIINDLHRAAGRSGVGTVMASEESQGGRGSWHQRCRQHKGSAAIHVVGSRAKSGARGERRDRARFTRHGYPSV